MDFGPHAPFTDPLNLAFAANRISWLKTVIATGMATEAHSAELAGLQARVAAYYQSHVDAFIARTQRSELAELGV